MMAAEERRKKREQMKLLKQQVSTSLYVALLKFQCKAPQLSQPFRALCASRLTSFKLNSVAPDIFFKEFAVLEDVHLPPLHRLSVRHHLPPISP